MTSATIPQLSLDDFQRDAVDAPEGPGLIIGGPGTGKTHTLIARIIAMVQQGVPTGNITYLTFNSQGAKKSAVSSMTSAKYSTCSSAPFTSSPATSSGKPAPQRSACPLITPSGTTTRWGKSSKNSAKPIPSASE